MTLLTLSQTKIDKSNAATGPRAGWQTAILHLAPAMQVVGHPNTCPAASDGCRAACLNTAGRGTFSNVQAARRRKTLYFLKQRAEFLSDLRNDISRFVKRCARMAKKPAVRLNGTSDIVWERVAPELFAEFPQVQFYDYTKLAGRFAHSIPRNYHLTLSRSEANDAEVAETARAFPWVNVAVVFDKALPAMYNQRPVIDGTLDDLRFLDPVGVVVGLLALGRARKDASGFVVR